MNSLTFIKQFYSIFDQSEIKDLNFIWGSEDFQFFKKRKKINISELLEEIKEYKLPSEVVPLSIDRHPFKGYDKNILLKLLKQALLYPEKEGRLCKSIHNILGFIRIKPKQYVVKEAHIDITISSPQLRDTFLTLGFEPDHFKELYPSKYLECYTMEFNPGFGDSKRIKNIHSYILRSCEAVKYHIQSFEECECYFEVESYSNKSIGKYEFKPISEEGVNNFPYSENTFTRKYIPNTSEEAKREGITLKTSKAVDIHVKIPTIYRGKGFEEASNHYMKQLCIRFIETGFYKIFSEGGNFIFTAQLLDVKIAKEIFRKLDSYAKKYGGIMGIKLEICTEFWRKKMIYNGKTYYSEIPHLIELNKHSR